MSLQLFVVCLAAGLAVTVITCLADRLGGRVGGLLATAPVVSTFSLIWVLTRTAGPSASVVLAGNYSVFGSLMATLGFIGTVRLIPGSDATRILVAEGMFLCLYLLAVLVSRWLIPLGPYLFSANFLLAGLLTLGLARREGSAVPERCILQLTIQRLAVRFAAGFLVVAVTGLAARVDPILGGAIAVFPGVYAVSLGIMGLNQSAGFSAEAAGSGIPGVLSILLFILGYWVSFPLIRADLHWGLLVGTALAWLQYSLGLILFGGRRSFACLTACSGVSVIDRPGRSAPPR